MRMGYLLFDDKSLFQYVNPMMIVRLLLQKTTYKKRKMVFFGIPYFPYFGGSRILAAVDSLEKSFGVAMPHC